MLLLGLLACQGEPVDTGPFLGEVGLRFTASSGVRDSSNLEDELVGTFYGSLFYLEQVTVTGPTEDAEDLEGVEVAVDLREVDTTEVLWTSGPLEPRQYLVLGFFDVDGNGAESKDPDEGDPVTLATTNAFEIVAGEQTERIVEFQLVLN